MKNNIRKTPEFHNLSRWQHLYSMASLGLPASHTPPCPHHYCTLSAPFHTHAAPPGDPHTHFPHHHPHSPHLLPGRAHHPHGWAGTTIQSFHTRRFAQAFHTQRRAEAFHTQRMDAAYHIKRIADVFHTQEMAGISLQSNCCGVSRSTDGCGLSH